MKVKVLFRMFAEGTVPDMPTTFGGGHFWVEATISIQGSLNDIHHLNIFSGRGKNLPSLQVQRVDWNPLPENIENVMTPTAYLQDCIFTTPEEKRTDSFQTQMFKAKEFVRQEARPGMIALSIRSDLD